MMDSITRAHAMRTLPRTMKLFHGYRDPFDQRTDLPFKSYVFSRFHLLGGQTYMNIIPALAGVAMRHGLDWRNIPCDKIHLDAWIWKQAVNNGYLSMSSDSVVDTLTNFLTEEQKQAMLHYVSPSLGKLGLYYKYNADKGKAQCINTGKLADSHALDYMLNTIGIYSTSTQRGIPPLKSLSYITLNVGHVTSAASPIQMDIPLSHAISEMLRIAPNTIVIFMSDHGSNHAPFSSWPQRKAEKRLPLLSIIVPRSYLDKVYSAIEYGLQYSNISYWVGIDTHVSTEC